MTLGKQSGVRTLARSTLATLLCENAYICFREVALDMHLLRRHLFVFSITLCRNSKFALRAELSESRVAGADKAAAGKNAGPRGITLYPQLAHVSSLQMSSILQMSQRNIIGQSERGG